MHGLIVSMVRDGCAYTFAKKMSADKAHCISCNVEIMRITADLNEGQCAPCADKCGGGTKFRYWRDAIESAECNPSEFKKLDKHGLGALHWSVDRGDRALFRRALEAGAPIDQSTAHCKLTPLHYSAEQENSYFLEALIEAGARLDQPDWKKCTPLHYAAENGFVEHSRKLIEAGCLPKPLDKYKRSPLDMAFVSGRVETIEFLASLSAARHRSWSDRLPLAVSSGQPAVVGWLLDRGANPNTRRDPYGRGVLEIARRPFPAKDYKLDGYTDEQIKELSSNHTQVIALIEDAIEKRSEQDAVSNP